MLFGKTYFFLVWPLALSLSICHLSLSAQTGQRFKRIDYDYDQMSGKVNEVHYQAGKPDAFYHRYEYDADNRITKAYTSKDSILWDQDARYVYYAHGPLSRVEIGDNKVQGMDYAYTLQGWIKGVNSNLLKSKNDIGNDGLGGSPFRVAKDAFGYTLNYHAGDYKPVDGSKWSNPTIRFEALTPNSDLMAASFDLFNGNISSMVTSIEEPKIYTAAPNEVPNKLPQGTAYTYDQLNRLLEMKAFQNLDVTTNTWKQGSTYAGSYHNTFQYDANGNILGQLRADGTGQIIDSLTYKYAKDATGRTKQNRLYHVNDRVSATVFSDDIDNQGAFYSLNANDGTNNYRYDSIGNLIQDRQEEIMRIDWTLYGKIKSITRFQGSLRSDLEFRYDAGGNRIAKIEKPRDANGVKPPSEWRTTYYVRDAQANVMGTYKHITVSGGPSFKVIERPLYGNSRLGSDYTELELTGLSTTPKLLTRTLGKKHYEGSNHLGNVLIVFADRKIPRDNDSDGAIDYFEPEVLGSNDYSPFGVVLDGREFGIRGRYGFNGKEGDDEVKGTGNSLDFGARIYDSRLGRWLSVDPSAYLYPAWSPYSNSLSNPIVLNDPNGEKPKVTIVENADGSVSITVTNSVYLVLDVLGNRSSAMKAIGEPSDFYGGKSVNTAVIINGEVRSATMTFNTEVKTYTDIDQAASDRDAAGYGTVVQYDKKARSSSFTKNTSKHGDFMVLAPKSATWKGDAAHEFVHDWAGLADTYVIVNGQHVFLVDGQDRIVRELMNDANSPLLVTDISRLAQAAVDKMTNKTGDFCGEFTESILDINYEAANKIGKINNYVRAIRDSHGNDANKLIVRPGKNAIFGVKVGEDNTGTKTGTSKPKKAEKRESHQNVRNL